VRLPHVQMMEEARLVETTFFREMNGIVVEAMADRLI
jgi:hypothetical protein